LSVVFYFNVFFVLFAVNFVIFSLRATVLLNLNTSLKTGHFGYVFLSKSLVSVLKKLDLTQKARSVCMNQNDTWYGGRPRPRRLCVRWGPRSPAKKGAEPQNFRPMFIVAKRLDGSIWYLAWRLASAQAALC